MRALLELKWNIQDVQKKGPSWKMNDGRSQRLRGGLRPNFIYNPGWLRKHHLGAVKERAVERFTEAAVVLSANIALSLLYYWREKSGSIAKFLNYSYLLDEMPPARRIL